MSERDDHRPADIDAMPSALTNEQRITPSLDGRGMRLGIVCARFNANVTGKLFEGARRQALLRGVDENDITVVFVPGAFEIPRAAQVLSYSGRVDAVVCLGAIIRGETTHYDLVSNESASGCQKVQLETGIPIGFGILSTENLDQALQRCGGTEGHKGAEAADVAIEMANLILAFEDEESDASAGE